MTEWMYVRRNGRTVDERLQLEHGNGLIDAGEASFVGWPAHADLDQGLWRYDVVDDENKDTLQVAIGFLRKLKNSAAEVLGNSLKAANSTVPTENGSTGDEDLRHTIRWLHRIGWYFRSDQDLRSQLSHWLRSADEDGRIAHSINTLTLIRKGLTRRASVAGSELFVLGMHFKPWISHLADTPPLGYACALDFPKDSPLDPWSPYRKWQYYSDVSYLFPLLRAWFPNYPEIELIGLNPKIAKDLALKSENPVIKSSRDQWVRTWRQLNGRTRYSKSDYAPMQKLLVDHPESRTPALTMWMSSQLVDFKDSMLRRIRKRGDLPRNWYIKGAAANDEWVQLIPRHAIRERDIPSLIRFLESEIRAAEESILTGTVVDQLEWVLESAFRNVKAALTTWKVHPGVAHSLDMAKSQSNNRRGPLEVVSNARERLSDFVKEFNDYEGDPSLFQSNEFNLSELLGKGSESENEEPQGEDEPTENELGTELPIRRPEWWGMIEQRLSEPQFRRITRFMLSQEGRVSFPTIKAHIWPNGIKLTSMVVRLRKWKSDVELSDLDKVAQPEVVEGEDAYVSLGFVDAFKGNDG